MSEANQYTFETPEYRQTYWHTCSHILAQAMKRLHPDVKLAIGPSIENGFNYDFDTPTPFSPEQMASRILGMGDIVALVKDVTSNIDAEKAKKMADRMRKSGRLDLNDFREQMVQMRSMGSMSSLLEKLPAEFQEAAAKQNVSDADADRMIRRTIGIIDSMTPAERRHPDLIKASRKRRIAAGAGLPVQEVNKLLKQYDQMSEVMKRMRKGGLSKLMRMAGGRFPGFGGRFPGFGGMR